MWGCPHKNCLWQGLCNGRVSVRPSVRLSVPYRQQLPFDPYLPERSSERAGGVSAVVRGGSMQIVDLTHLCTYIPANAPTCLHTCIGPT